MTRYSPMSGTEIMVEPEHGWNVLRSTRDDELCEVAESIADGDIILRDGEPVAIAGPAVVARLKAIGRVTDEIGLVADDTGLLGSVQEALEEMRDAINERREQGELTGFDFQPVSFAIGELRDIRASLNKFVAEVEKEGL
jgi:hypothetical protein